MDTRASATLDNGLVTTLSTSHDRCRADARAPRSRPVLLVPGLRDSGATHWQSEWQRVLPRVHRVYQDDWNTPDLARWSAAVARAIDAIREPALVVAHSFGCLASVQALAHYKRAAAGLLLVAPADPDRFGLGATLSTAPLHAPATLVASSNDPWLRLTKAAHLASRWHARLVALANAGHVNAESGYGPWSEGRALLAGLAATAATAAQARAGAA